MNTQARLTQRLNRISLKVDTRRNQAYREVEALAFKGVEYATQDEVTQHRDAIMRYQEEIVQVQWGDGLARTRMSQVQLEGLLSALACCDSYGPIEEAAIALAALLTDCDDPVEHRLKASARFSCTLPEMFKGPETVLESKLCFDVGVQASFQHCAQAHSVSCDECMVEVNEGYMTIRGRLTFTLDLCNDVEVPRRAVLRELLSVTISNETFGDAPGKCVRTAVRELVILSTAIR
jgi:hypothetical protein